MKDRDPVVDEVSMNEKFRKLHDRNALRKALEEYDTLCENMDKEKLEGELKSRLNSIGFRSRGADRAKDPKALELNKVALDTDRKRFEIAKNIYIQRFFQAANGRELASDNSLVDKIRREMFGTSSFDDDMQASSFTSEDSDELRGMKAALRAVDEEGLDLKGESTEVLYKKLETLRGPKRYRNIVLDVLSAREGFDAIPSVELKKRMSTMNKNQQEVAQYVIEVLRDSKRSW